MATFWENTSSTNYSLISPTQNSEKVLDVEMEAITLGCVYSVMSLIAIFGNILVIMSVRYDYTLRSYTSNYFLANLAVADLFQGAISIPLRILEVLKVNYDPNLLCRIGIPTSILFGSASNLAILVISIDRFLAIQCPYLYLRYATTKAIFGIVALMWTISCSLGISAATRLVWLTPEVPTTICRFPVYLSKNYILAMYVIVHAIPIGTVVLLYGFILKASLRHVRRIHAQEFVIASTSVSPLNEDGKPPTMNTSGTTSNNHRREIVKQGKGAKTVSIIVGLFIILVLPIIGIDLAEMLGAPPAPAMLTKIAVCMIYANNCVNVLVYAGFNQDYRRAFKRIIKKIAFSLREIIPCANKCCCSV